nr:CusA/CzcA family heavy metal efflux RND transporter [Armatimonas rosea]
MRFAIRQRLFIVMLGFLLLGIGGYNALQLPIDAVPDITTKQVVINATATGLGPEEIERQLTFPLEVALAGTPKLKETRSISQFGLSQVTVVFDDDTDLYFARQLVAERLTVAQGELPPGATAEMGPVSTGLGELSHIKLENPNLSLRERRALMDWVVRPQLLTVPGLAEVNPWGGTVRQWQVKVDPQKLLAYGLTLRDLTEALEKNNQNASGSYLAQGASQAMIRSVGMLTGPEDIKHVVVAAKDGIPITVGMLATVEEGDAIRQGAFSEDGIGEQSYCVALLLIGENGRIVMQGVGAKLKQIEKTLPAGSKLVGFLNRDVLINRTLETATKNLTEGGLLVIVVLFAFLLQLRAGLIVSSVIPLAMLFAIIGMRHWGISANLMSLGALDFGLIVDGAVIIVENTVRQLAERRHHLHRDLTEDERQHVLYEAALEVLKPSLFGIFIIIATYLPILTLQGVEGKMFRPMGLTVILALLGALLLSLTWVPALCAYFLKVKEEKPNRVLEVIERFYAKLLQGAVRARMLTAGLALGFVVGCFALFPLLGSTFIPELDEGAAAISGFYAPGTSLEEVVDRSQRLETALRTSFPDEVKKVVTRIGRPEVATDPMLIHQTDTLIELWPKAHWKRARTKEELVRKLSELTDKSPGFEASYTQPVKMRMDEMVQGQGLRAELGIKLFGTDNKVLAEVAAKMATIVEKVRGAADVSVEATEGMPQLQIELDRAAIARWGVSVSDINAVIETALASKTVTSITDGSQRVEVNVRLEKPFRDDTQKIGRLLVPTSAGSQVPLGSLAKIGYVNGPIQISRENGQRRVVVMSNVRGRDLGGFTEEVQQRLQKEIHLPTGYRMEFGGTYEQLQSGRARLMVVVPLTFLAVFVMLFMTLGSLKQAALVFTGIPFAITGGILALLARQMPFSISAGIGFIALAGIAVLNGLVMITFINQLRQEGRSVAEAVHQGALARLRPVLMTASVASIGFIPMALATGSGAEVQKPLATVVIGGLITSTLLTLVVLPTLYAWFEQGKKETL